MTAAQFLACLRIIAARRVKPDKIISGNAPQFKVAKNAIDLAWETLSKILMLSAMLMNVESSSPSLLNSLGGQESSTKDL